MNVSIVRTYVKNHRFISSIASLRTKLYRNAAFIGFHSYDFGVCDFHVFFFVTCTKSVFTATTYFQLSSSTCISPGYFSSQSYDRCKVSTAPERNALKFSGLKNKIIFIFTLSQETQSSRSEEHTSE